MSAIDLNITQFSDCGKYRYTLRRDFLTGNKRVCFVMLNPSDANAHRNDPTTRRAVSFAQRFDCLHYLAVNLYALVSTDPKELKKSSDPIGTGMDLGNLERREAIILTTELIMHIRNFLSVRQ